MTKRQVLERVAELTTPAVIGRRYLVPTVRYKWNEVWLDWPVIGPRHDDLEHLQFAPQHFHIDSRFAVGAARVAMLRYKSSRIPEGATEADRLGFIATAVPLMRHERLVPLPDPIERSLRCMRPSSFGAADLAARVSTFRSLFTAYAGRRCGRDAEGRLVCPHKGAPLGSLEPDADGHVTCPLHGLVVDPASGIVVGPQVPAQVSP